MYPRGKPSRRGFASLMYLRLRGSITSLEASRSHTSLMPHYLPHYVPYASLRETRSEASSEAFDTNEVFDARAL